MSINIDSTVLWNRLFNFLTTAQNNINIPKDFKGRMDLVNFLLDDDHSGLVSTIYEFMVKTATTRYRFESNNETLTKFLAGWMKNVNAGVGVDIPKGLRDLSGQYYRERWKSSFIGIVIYWEDIKLGTDTFEVPNKIIVVDGSQIRPDGTCSVTGGYEYYLGPNKEHPLRPTAKKSVIIRKPFESNYKKWPSPYLVKKGAMFNALLKTELLQKQADLIHGILPYMFMIKAGNDILAQNDNLPNEEELTALKDQVKEIQGQYSNGDRTKGMSTVGAFEYDVDISHLIPDLTKFFTSTIVAPIDRNLLSSLGLVELEGFSKSRQETILNPKVLVEEVKESVLDWSAILEDVMEEMLKRNRAKHRKYANSVIRVVPGTVKSFITDDMKVLMRSWYDRGIISKKGAIENTTDLDFEIEVTRRDMERKRNLDERMFPPVIMNQDNGTEPDVKVPEDTKNKIPEQKKSEGQVAVFCEACQIDVEVENAEVIRCPKCENLLDATHHIKKDKKKKEKAIKYETIDDLPEEIKSTLSIPEQIKYVKNSENKS